MLGAAAVLAGSTAVACGGQVDGTPTAAQQTVVSTGGGDLSPRLLAAEAFPPGYPAVVLPEHAVAMAASDLAGVTKGGVVDPPDCTPAPQAYDPSGTVMAVGTNGATRATLSVEVARVDTPLAQHRRYLSRCAKMSVDALGATAEVTTTLDPDDPDPESDADDALGYTRSVVSGGSERRLDQSMVTRVAQCDDVRVSVTLMSFGAGAPDTGALDEVFAHAVDAARSG
nr:sensor domain-containing protein [Rhodococcus sp. HNM0569]